ncbi:hypothetical protein DL769_009092 [Monosporascus sp. CRB-8-3]|nr:hypothetical protein DL769_009092 [Monosporascus sp. CRB-8-3]
MVLLGGDTRAVYPGGAAYQLFAGCLRFGTAPGLNQSFAMREGTLEGATGISLPAGHMAEAGWDRVAVVRHTATALSATCWSRRGPRSRARRSSTRRSTSQRAGPRSRRETRTNPVGARPEVAVDTTAAHPPVMYSADPGRTFGTREQGVRASWAPRRRCASRSRDGDNNARRVDISAPFAHPNPTLDWPLVDDGPKPYFPRGAASDGYYSPGRAFPAWRLLRHRLRDVDALAGAGLGAQT